MGRLSPFTFALSLLACGSTSNLSTDASLAECRVVDGFTFQEHGGVVLSTVADDDRVGVLWRQPEEAWALFFGSFHVEEPRVATAVNLGEVPATTRVGLQSFRGDFAVAWVDFQGCFLGTGCPDDASRPGRVHVTIMGGTQVVDDVVVEGSLPGHVALGAVDDSLTVFWEEDDFELDRARVIYATSQDLTFDSPMLLYEGPGSFGGVRVAPSAGALAVTWLAGRDSDTAPMFAVIEGGHVVVPPVRLEGHRSRTWDVQIAAGTESYGIATIEHDGVDSLYFSVVDRAGLGDVQELSISRPFVPWDIDLAWGGMGWAAVASGYRDPEAGSDPLLLLQQFDAEGRAAFSALYLLAEPVRDPHIARLGKERYIVSWGGESVAGALVDCSP